SGLLRRGACHRTARLRAGPLAPRNDENDSQRRDIVTLRIAPRLRGDYARTYAPCDDRMAGMSPPALCARIATRILVRCCRQAAALSSQIGGRNVGRCSPLEGESSTPPRRRTKPGPQGPGFLLGADD